MSSNEARPSPDELLAQVEAEEEQAKHGRLKIFLGYAAGVGKTYAMLEAAHQRKRDTDLVVAYVETHGRVETEALLTGLEIVPRRHVEHSGVALPEMDLDAVLARRPRLALVDELAHTNAPGSRHAKRYQDVEELLEAGIDVYATLNIQHLESLRNVVAQVTGAWVREAVPDSVVDNAAEIEIVDLPPDELLKRLQEGKVYVPEQIATATAKFFRKGNLTALRELTMRTAARHVDEQMRDYMKTHTIPGPWATAERLLVYVGPDPAGAVLVRTARRLASQLRAEWYVAHVETPGNVLSPAKQALLDNTLRLAERMGAKTVTIQGHSIASAITEFARTHNVSKIVVGKPRPTGWRRFLGAPDLIRIIGQSEYFDVYVVGGRAERVEFERPPRQEGLPNWRGYLAGAGFVAVATLLVQLVHQLFSPLNVTVVYLLCVAMTAVFWGLGPSFLASALAILAFDFFFVPPFLNLNLANSEYWFTFLSLLLVSILISYPTSRVRQQTETARRRERETATLYALARDMAVVGDLESYIRAIINRTRETFGREAVVFLPDNQNKGTLKPYAETKTASISESDIAAAFWSFDHQKTVGPGTDTLPNARARYEPLVTARGAIGVLALWAEPDTRDLSIEQERILGAYADLAAVGIEGILLAEEARNAQLLRATEKLQTALLNSISQDLRTPLISVLGALLTLEEKGPRLDEAATKQLVHEAIEDAELLNHLITNLLDMSRIEAGALRPRKEPYAIRLLVDTALDQLSIQAGTRTINMDVPSDLPAVSADLGLIVQALVNVLDNALKYSASHSPIDISARRTGNQIEVEIADRGIGIPPQDLKRVFDKFYRVERPDNVAGTGLGLTIAKGIVEAHGGRIVAENRAGGGTIIRLTLPVPAAD